MIYVSTRSDAPELHFEQAATCGLAADGGLYVPKSWPTLSHEEIRAMRGLSYIELANRILSHFTGDDISDTTLRELTHSAYSGFDHPQIAPLREIQQDVYLLELFHGPTYSFKDYALQFLGKFMDWSLRRREENLTIVGATSGDTGSAAIRAVAGTPNINLYMLHPFKRVSEMQRRQMTTSQELNIFNYAVDGTFDDCQFMVKAIFNDKEVRNTLSLGAVNSINWGRIAAQVVYYFYAGLQLGAPDTAVSFAVPTGNFGNVFAGYTARKMGLPIDRMLVCSNANDILTRFFETGMMQKQGVKQTVTPSMDIQISSNFERFLFELLERDGEKVGDLINRLNQEGEFSVQPEILEKARSHFQAHRVSNQQTCESITRQYEKTGLIIDPHTAVALAATERSCADLGSPVVVISTAHPAKFLDTIENSIGKSIQLPAPLKELAAMPERYRLISRRTDELKKLMLSP